MKKQTIESLKNANPLQELSVRWYKSALSFDWKMDSSNKNTAANIRRSCVSKMTD